MTCTSNTSFVKAATLALLVLILTACGQPACDPRPGWRPDGQQCD